MATSTKFPNKMSLEQITMHENKFWTLVDTQEDIFTWMINDFRDLGIKEEYLTHCEQNDWIFKIVKYYSGYIIKIDTEQAPYHGEITFLVSYDSELYSRSFNVRKVRDFLYRVQVPTDVIHAPENTFLPFDTVVFDFRWRRRSCLVNITCGRSSKEPSQIKDKTNLFENISLFSNHRPYTDFFIRAKGRSFGVHKSILAARSKYFREYIKENYDDDKTGEIEMDVPKDVVNSLICLIYTGQMPSPPSKSEYEELITLSKVLGIPKFKHGIKIYVSNDIKDNNMSE